MSEGGIDVLFSTLPPYIRGILAHIPGTHWAIIWVLTVISTVFLVAQKKYAFYSAITLGIVVFVGSFLLDTAVAIRYFGAMSHETGFDLKLDIARLFRKTGNGPIEMISNVAVFVPFGFFLSEFLVSTKRFVSWRRLGFVTLVGFGLSFSIECLQLLLCVGFFELTDLVMNTSGAFLGASMAVLVRVLWKRSRYHRITNT